MEKFAILQSGFITNQFDRIERSEDMSIDFRSIILNKDYSEKGRRSNIETAMSIASFLSNKKFIVLVSLVSPYLDLREKFKEKNNVLEFYLHTSQVRGKEQFWVDNYQAPKSNYTEIITDKKIEEKDITSIFFYFRFDR